MSMQEFKIHVIGILMVAVFIVCGGVIGIWGTWLTMAIINAIAGFFWLKMWHCVDENRQVAQWEEVIAGISIFIVGSAWGFAISREVVMFLRGKPIYVGLDLFIR